MTIGVGLALARSERERRRARQRQLERQLGLQPGESLSGGLRRMALGQADLAIELLEGGGGNGASPACAPDEHAVHETRKALKRLRALLRLLEHELGKQAYARESAALRDIARQL
ncbi:MAG: CHAD domain-containing protein, partial [Solirubrobacteraceae bacterium]